MTLRQTNTPEGLQLAAAIEQRIVEQEAIDMIEAANSKLYRRRREYSETRKGFRKTRPWRKVLRPSVETSGQPKTKT
jgi:hypothetical protein